MKRADLHRLTRLLVHIGARLEQRFHGRLVAEERRQAQRMEAIRRVSVEERGIRGEQFAHARGLTGRGGFEDVQRRAALEQLLDASVVAPVLGLQDLADRVSLSVPWPSPS